VLLVEDEPDLVRLMEFNLQQAGFETRAVGRASDALRVALADPPDVILLDLMLPDGSGTEVCRQLKAAPATRSVPVIMVTAKGEEIDRVVGFELGADDYVVKPFSVRELVLRVRAILRRTDAAAEGPDDVVSFGRLRRAEGCPHPGGATRSMCGALCRRQGVYVGYARRGLVASASAPTGYHHRAPLSGLELPCFLRALSRGLRGISRPPEHVGATALTACAP
jgi:CheY-like chemotaxis protein